jgi:DNA polymerase
MSENKQQALDIIAEQIKKCALCAIGSSGLPVAGEGNPDARIVFIGEAPGKNEAKTGRPFIGRSGVYLRQLIRGIPLTEEQVFITSPVKYLPDRGTPSTIQIRHARQHLLQQLAVINPDLIVLLGRVAAEGTLGEKIAVMKEHGRFIERNGKKYFITLHPSAALRFQSLRKIIENDFLLLRDSLNNG